MVTGRGRCRFSSNRSEALRVHHNDRRLEGSNVRSLIWRITSNSGEQSLIPTSVVFSSWCELPRCWGRTSCSDTCVNTTSSWTRASKTCWDSEFCLWVILTNRSCCRAAWGGGGPDEYSVMRYVVVSFTLPLIDEEQECRVFELWRQFRSLCGGSLWTISVSLQNMLCICKMWSVFSSSCCCRPVVLVWSCRCVLCVPAGRAGSAGSSLCRRRTSTWWVQKLWTCWTSCYATTTNRGWRPQRPWSTHTSVRTTHTTQHTHTGNTGGVQH